jgi:hypothetical protein
MATLAESFLADLEDLSEEEEENEKQHITGETADAEVRTHDDLFSCPFLLGPP